jgi:hypothetical protein
MQAEADFRSLVAVPCAAVIASASLSGVSHWILLATPFALALAFSGWQQADLSIQYLIESIRVGKVSLFEGTAMPDIRWRIEADHRGIGQPVSIQSEIEPVSI